MMMMMMLSLKGLNPPDYLRIYLHLYLYYIIYYVFWVPRQLVAYMATFGTQFFSLKCYNCHIFTKFVMLKTNR